VVIIAKYYGLSLPKPFSNLSSYSLLFLPSSLFSSKGKEEDKPLKTKTIAWIKRRGKNKSYSGGLVNF
jgi:hypothetical protein